MKLTDKIADLFFPEKCIFCEKLISDGNRRARDICLSCGMQYIKTDGYITLGREFTLCISPLVYTGDARNAIRRYKFSGHDSYYRALAVLMANVLQSNREYKNLHFDAVTWVPVSVKRRRIRGYDQSKLLAEGLSKAEKLPKATELLKKPKDNPAQSTLSGPQARLANVKGVYHPVSNADISGKTVLLVDDIITTGATLNACAKALKDAGAAAVYCVTAAKTPILK